MAVLTVNWEGAGWYAVQAVPRRDGEWYLVYNWVTRYTKPYHHAEQVAVAYGWYHLRRFRSLQHAQEVLERDGDVIKAQVMKLLDRKAKEMK